MSRTTVTGDSYTTDDPANKGGVTYILGITFGILVILIILSYTSYKCNRGIHSSSPPQADDDINDHHQLVTVHRGVDDDVLVTFPVFIYSEQTRTNSVNCSDCSICLADYKPADVVRLLPECDHLFHVSCIDTWLKVHSTCPMCRNSPSPLAVKLSIQRS